MKYFAFAIATLENCLQMFHWPSRAPSGMNQTSRSARPGRVTPQKSDLPPNTWLKPLSPLLLGIPSLPTLHMDHKQGKITFRFAVQAKGLNWSQNKRKQEN